MRYQPPRSRGQRRRRSSRLVRSRPTVVQRIPPVPYIGGFSKMLYATAITDYESKANASWNTADLWTRWRGPGASPEFRGDQYETLYYAVEVPEESTDTVEKILNPIRYTIDEPAADYDDFDYWDDIGGIPGKRTMETYGIQNCALDTLLPVSGNSHVSDGKPTWIRMANGLNGLCAAQAWHDYAGWNPTTFFNIALPEPFNWEVFPRYVRLRLNGSAFGSLIDTLDFFDLAAELRGRFWGWVYPEMYLSFPSFPGFSGGNGIVNVTDFEFDFTAGDTFEMDVWWEFRHEPHAYSGTGSKWMCATCGRHRTTDSLRPGVKTQANSSDASYWPYGHAQTGAVLWVNGLPFGDGYDPETDTWNLLFSTCDWYPGDGSTGTHKVETANGWTRAANSRGFNWWGTIQDGGTHDGKQGQIIFSLDREVAELWVYLNTTLQVYRPQDSGDYVQYATDRSEGDLVNSPCGVCNHLGTTVFAKYHGSRDSSTIIPADPTFPDTITLTHTAL